MRWRHGCYGTQTQHRLACSSQIFDLSRKRIKTGSNAGNLNGRLKFIQVQLLITFLFLFLFLFLDFSAGAVCSAAAFGGGADMGKVASDKTKAEVKKYEKRAKDASKFLKNKGRSFGSMMREKYMR